MHFFSGVLLLSSSSFRQVGMHFSFSAEFSMPSGRPCRPGPNTISFRLCLLWCPILFTESTHVVLLLWQALVVQPVKLSHLSLSSSITFQQPFSFGFVFFIWSEISVYSGRRCRGYTSGLLVVIILTVSWLPFFRNLWMLTFFFFPNTFKSHLSSEFILFPGVLVGCWVPCPEQEPPNQWIFVVSFIKNLTIKCQECFVISFWWKQANSYDS